MMNCSTRFSKIPPIVSIFLILVLGLPGFAVSGAAIDLSGEWDLTLRSGMSEDADYGANEIYEAKITQEGADFYCTCVTSGKRYSAGDQIVKGQVVGSVFGEVYVQTVKDPVSFTLEWVRGNGVVLENGNSLIVQVFNEMHAANVTVTMKKKNVNE